MTQAKSKLTELQMSTTLKDLEEAQERIQNLEEESEDLQKENEGLHVKLEASC